MSLLPEIQFENLFSADPLGQKFWSEYLGQGLFQKFHSEFQQMGKNAALATSLAREADRQVPQLSQAPEGSKISYHDSYLKLQELSYGAGIVSRKYDPDFLREHRLYRHRIGFSIAYYFAQTETGLFCPICMTDALGRVLEREAQHIPLAQKTLQHIGSSQLKDLWQGAMFLTEKQGGSDVGANRVMAEKQGDEWLLSGEKWFCSNADAEATLILARMPDESGKEVPGTKGLGLFLALKNTPTGNAKRWKMKRLKDKLGVRSMASAEIDLEKVSATLLGGVGQGFKMMTEMVNMSRLYNSVASLAIARRSLLEASEFGRQRSAFGKKLIELPLWKASLADLSAEVFAMKLFVFEAIRCLDLADQGDREAADILRILTPLSKALSGKLAVFAAREAMELVGGNAYIEDHILPRLLRDALVLPIWEGTTNIQALDLLRSFQKEGAQVLQSRIQTALSVKGSPQLKPLLEKRVQDYTQRWLPIFAKSSPQELESLALELLHQTGRLLQFCLLFESSASQGLAEISQAAFLRLHQREDFFSALGRSPFQNQDRGLLEI